MDCANALINEVMLREPKLAHRSCKATDDQDELGGGKITLIENLSELLKNSQ